MKTIHQNTYTTISKSRAKRSYDDIIADIQNANYILTQPHFNPKPNGNLYHVVIGKTKIDRAEVLHFNLTNNLFNRIHKEIDRDTSYINYLFILEYPKALSMGIEIPTSTELHAHIIINTNIPQSILKSKLQEKLPIDFHLYFENISDRTDNGNLVDYFTKQATINYFFTNKHYNYKILFNSPKPII